MKKLVCALFILFFLSLPGQVKAKDGIPEARFRVIYKDTGMPVEWAAVRIECFRQYGWFGADEEKTYGAFFYAQAPDGWITIPRVDAPGTDTYEIQVWVPGCSCIDNPDTAGWRISAPFNNKTLPRFMKKPPAERVFYVTPEYNECGACCRHNSWGGLPYEGLRYEIAQRAMDFDQWPKLSACYAGHHLEDGHSREERRQKEGPYFKRWYCKEISSLLFWTHEEMKLFAKGAEKRKWSSEKIEATVSELEGLVRDLICSDIQKKKEQWGRMTLAEDILNDPIIKGCEALKGVKAVTWSGEENVWGCCENVPP